jgi:hypothetical protein
LTTLQMHTYVIFLIQISCNENHSHLYSDRCQSSGDHRPARLQGTWKNKKD